MAITVTNKIPHVDSSDVLHAVAAISANSPDLTPRSYATLRELSRQSRVAIATDADTVVGWLIAEPLTETVDEIGMAYVHPEYRKRGLLKQMIPLLLQKNKTQVFATYQPELLQYAITTHGFTRSTFRGVLFASKGTFLKKRLSLTILTKIVKRTAKQNVQYGIRKAQS